MKWLSINDQKPKHGQKIIPYFPEMNWNTWIASLILPIMIWDEEKQIASNERWGCAITHWLPVPTEPEKE
jgi:hypothetical protein